MKDWWTPAPALLIADSRTGGTMLAHALDSHPQIGFERGQVLHKRSAWRAQLAPDACAAIAWSRPGYHVAGFRVVYGEFDQLSDGVLLRCCPRILWLTRDPLTTVVSRLLLKAAQASPDAYAAGLHRYEDEPLAASEPLTLDGADVRSQVETVLQADGRIEARLARLALPVLRLRYETLTQPHEFEGLYCSEDIIDFLGVGWCALRPNVQRVHPLPMSRYVTNWREVYAAVEGEAESCG